MDGVCEGEGISVYTEGVYLNEGEGISVYTEGVYLIEGEGISVLFT
jgi:hypothetical protein